MSQGIMFRDEHGQTVMVEVIDSGVVDGYGQKLYQLAVNSAVTIDPGTITIGAVTLKDQDSATAADVSLVTSATEGMNGVVVQAPVLGKTNDTADLTGSTTTLNSKLRGLIQLFVARVPVVGQALMAASSPVVLASDQSSIPITVADGSDATQGVTTGAAVVTDANGTVQQYLRGLVKLIVAKISIKVVDGDDATQGITTGAAVVTDVAGTVQQYLRGLVKLFAARIPVSGQAAMAASLPVVIASDQSSVTTTHNTQTVAPTNQASTASYVDFTGSTIDSLINTVLSYTLLNTDVANGLSWQILAANAVDFSDSVVAQAGANIVAAAVGTYSANPPLYRYYKVQIKDTIGAAHATGQLRGIARG